MPLASGKLDIQSREGLHVHARKLGIDTGDCDVVAGYDVGDRARHGRGSGQYRGNVRHCRSVGTMSTARRHDTAAECGKVDAFVICSAELGRNDERGIWSGPRKVLGGGKRAIKRHARNRDVYVTLAGSRVLCGVHATKWSSRTGVCGESERTRRDGVLILRGHNGS